jgi:hypothetical protein
MRRLDLVRSYFNSQLFANPATQLLAPLRIVEFVDQQIVFVKRHTARGLYNPHQNFL